MAVLSLHDESRGSFLPSLELDIIGLNSVRIRDTWDSLISSSRNSAAENTAHQQL